MGRQSTDAPGAVGPPVFATTHWSVVLAAANEETPEAAAALERLCRTYWYPLYAYVRREGHSPPDAQDLTQEFFARLLAGLRSKNHAQLTAAWSFFLILRELA